MAAEEHSELTTRTDNKICLPQRCARIRHAWIWENFQTPPEGPRAGLKDSQIAYPCIGVVVPLPNQFNNSWIKSCLAGTCRNKCDISVATKTLSRPLPRLRFAKHRNRHTIISSKVLRQSRGPKNLSRWRDVGAPD